MEKYNAREYIFDIGYFALKMIIVICLSNLFIYSIGAAMTSILIEELPAFCEKLK